MGRPDYEDSVAVGGTSPSLQISGDNLGSLTASGNLSSVLATLQEGDINGTP